MLTGGPAYPCSIASILISRFLIDLQTANGAGTQPQQALSSEPFSALEFNRVIGSIGSSLPAPSIFATRAVDAEPPDSQHMTEVDSDAASDMASGLRVIMEGEQASTSQTY